MKILTHVFSAKQSQNNFRSSILGFIIFFVLCFMPLPSSIAALDEMEFTVPVNLKNLMPEVKKVSVHVWVYDKDKKLVGLGDNEVPVSEDGIVNTKVKVKLFLDDKGMSFFSAVKYETEFYLNDGGPKWKAPTSKPDPEFPWRQSKPGTVLVSKQTGDLPKLG